MASAPWSSNPWLWVISFKLAEGPATKCSHGFAPSLCTVDGSCNGPVERPILFRGEMVRAILEGRKTQTRRVVKLRHGSPYCIVGERSDGATWPMWFDPNQGPDYHPEVCPYGKPGDRLWVRETWGVVEGEDGASRWVAYAATPGQTRRAPEDSALKRCWKPSIHMPRWACRLVLDVTDVRVERLQDISDADALAEGISTVAFRPDDGFPVCDGYMAGSDDGKMLLQTTPRAAFQSLWESIHG